MVKGSGKHLMAVHWGEKRQDHRIRPSGWRFLPGSPAVVKSSALDLTKSDCWVPEVIPSFFPWLFLVGCCLLVVGSWW